MFGYITSKKAPTSLPRCINTYMTETYFCKWLHLVNQTLCWQDDYHPWIEGSCTQSTDSDVPDRSLALPFKTNMEMNLHCSYCGLLVCNIWRGFTLQFKEKGRAAGRPYLTNIFVVKIQLCLGSQEREGKHLDSTMTEENLAMQLHSSTAHRQMQIHYHSLTS